MDSRKKKGITQYRANVDSVLEDSSEKLKSGAYTSKNTRKIHKKLLERLRDKYPAAEMEEENRRRVEKIGNYIKKIAEIETGKGEVRYGVTPIVKVGEVIPDHVFETLLPKIDEPAESALPVVIEEAPLHNSFQSKAVEDMPVTHPVFIPTAEEKLALIGDVTRGEKSIEMMEKEYKECEARCKEMRQFINDQKAGKPYEYELNIDAKLFDLFHKIVLHPGADWKDRIKNLIEIRHDVKGDRLSGPSYFEALFQLAFYLGIFKEMAGFKREFSTKKSGVETNFLYNTDVQSGGGKEQGISDITFKLLPQNSSSTTTAKSSSYACGEYPEDTQDYTNTTYYISVKRYTKEKSPKYYDIGELFTFIAKGAPNTKFNLCVCCKDKKEFLKRMKAARSDYLTSSVNEIYGFVDQTDDNDMKGLGLLQLFDTKRREIFSNMTPAFNPMALYTIAAKDVEAWVRVNYPENTEQKDTLSLYFHQELVVESVMMRINEQIAELNADKKYVCIGVLPRGGKSFIAGGIIKRLLEKHVAKSNTRFWVLFMTSAISETISQFEADLINKFSDFKDFDFVNLRNKDKKNPYVPKKPHSFVFVSRELLTGIKKGKDSVEEEDSEKDIKVSNGAFSNIFGRLGFKENEKVPFNLVMFDEAHRGGITDLTRHAINNHIKGAPPFVLMTATYKKLADDERGFIHTDKDLFIWDLDDIQLMKQLPVLGIERFKEGELDEFKQAKKYGLFGRYDENLIMGIINQKLLLGQTLENIVKPYNNFPEPVFLSATFHQDVVHKLQLKQKEGGHEGFSIKEHFEHKPLDDADTLSLIKDKSRWQEWYKILKNIPKAIALRSYLTPNDDGKMLDGSAGIDVAISDKTRILNRIFAYTQKKMGVNARPSYGTPFSILMFLPTGGNNQRIGAASRAWGSLLLNSKYWHDNFIILGLSEFIEDKGENLIGKPVNKPAINALLEPVAIDEASKDEDAPVGGYYSLSVMSGGVLTGDAHKGCLKESELWPYCSEDELVVQKDLKSKIIAIERAALKERKGLVILTGQRAAMGISLPCVDLVCLLDDDKEPDMIIQKMYRALTDSRGKKYGFIFDFNVRRIFEAKFAYANTINFSAKGAALQTAGQLMEHEFNSCLWDSDAWASKIPLSSFNDYMTDIKRQLLGDIEASIYKQYEKDIEQKDIQRIDESILDKEIIEILKDGVIKGNKKASIVYQAPDTTAPPAAKKKTIEGDDAEDGNINARKNIEDDSETEDTDTLVGQPTPEDIETTKKLLTKITKQFVNLLYIRSFPSDVSVDKTLLATVLEQFDIHKMTYERELTKGTNLLEAAPCDSDNNLYVRLLQDLTNFVPMPNVKWYKKPTKDEPEGIPYVGPTIKEKDRINDYAKIAAGTHMYLKGRMDQLYEAVYHPLAKYTINKWAVSIKKMRINIFTTVTIKDVTGNYITIDNYLSSLDPENIITNLPSDIKNEQRSRVVKMLNYIRNRFGNFKKEKNATFFIYSNYLESFMTSLTKASPNIQSGGDISSTKRYNAILQEIEDHLVPDDKARTERGEIFTPPDLVREMLYGLNKASFAKNQTKIFGITEDNTFESQNDSERAGGLPESVWKNPNLKWLDPANGIGNFPIIAFYKLDFNLKSLGKRKLDNGETVDFSNTDARRKHIIEKMLYMIELDRGNIETSKGIFKKIHPGVKANILCGNTLMMTYDELLAGFNKINKTLETLKFDIIMGNPPFNPPKTETGSSGNSIWQNFVMKSFSILNDSGYLVFVHPPGWKKPTDEIYRPELFLDGNHYKDDDKTGKITLKQIRQGQIWQFLRDKGNYDFICTNDQKKKQLKGYLDFFPAVDYYVYQKNAPKSTCDSKNIFLGDITNSLGVKLNYNLSYLSNLITKQTQYILYKITSKEGPKPNFHADRKLAFGKTLFAAQSKKSYKYIYTANKNGPIYAYSNTKIPNVDEDKIIMNFDGGIDAYFVKYITKKEQIGSAHKSMYSGVYSDKEGKRLESFFKSDIVKFIFLITQYASGQRTQNEPLVANSITIPSDDTADYYNFFGIEEYKTYIENILTQYETFKAPKDNGTRRTKGPPQPKVGGSRYPNKTRKNSR